MNYTFQIGETILLQLEAVSGDVGEVTAASAAMRDAGDPAQEIALTLTERGATNDIGPGWDVRLDAATCATLAPGIYRVDARLEIGGVVVITDPARVRLKPR